MTRPRLRVPALAAAISLAATAASLPASASAGTPPPVTEQQVKAQEARVEQLGSRLASLLSRLNEASELATEAGGNLAVARLRLQRAEARRDEARNALDSRAREVYMRGRVRQAYLALGMNDMRQTLSVGSMMAAAMQKDAEALRKHSEAVEAIREEQGSIDRQRLVLQANKQKLDALRGEITQALRSQEEVLAASRAELARLKALRARVSRSGRTNSPIVEARRSARQAELDKKLALLLGWIASRGETALSPSGIVSEGLATWYGPGFDGRRASSGATFRQEQLTAASLVLPFGTILKVTYNGRSVMVVITDRGPYVAGRVLDLSAGASAAIGHSGVKLVRMEIMSVKDPVGSPAPPFP